MTRDPQRRVESFLAMFFGPGNELQLADIDTPGSRQNLLQPWVRRLRQQPWLPTILPRRSKGALIWYGIAPDAQQMRALSSMVMAFVGPSYSTFRADSGSPEPDDDLEVAVSEWTNGSYFRFTAKAGGWDAICRMQQVLARKPIRSEIQYRGPGRLLREFETALATSNRAAAEAVLRELGGGGYLDSLNIAFLKVQLLGQFRATDELLSLPEFPDLLAVRRPRVVTSILLEAVYDVEFRAFEASNDATGAFARFRTSVESAYPALWQIRSGFTSPAALKMLILAAVAGGTPDPATRDRILAIATPSVQDAAWLRLLAALLPGKPPAPMLTIDAAERAYLDGDCDLAWEIARQLEPSVRAGCVLLQSARDVDTLEVRRTALDMLSSYSEAIRARIRARKPAARAWQALEGEADTSVRALTPATAVPRSWLEWIEALFATTATQRLVTIARAGETEWDLGSILLVEDGIDRIVDAFHRNKTDEQEHVLAAVLPLLYRALDRLSMDERASFKRVYFCIRDRLLEGETASLRDLELHNEVLRALLPLGVTKEQYGALLSDALGVWAKELQSPRYAEWALDLFDLLVESPVLSADLRAQVPVAIRPMFDRHRTRLDHGIVALYNRLCNEIGLFDLHLAERTDEVSTSGDLAWLSHKTILLYTLQPGVPERVRQMIDSAAKDVTVHISADLVGTDRLRTATRHSDLVVIATKSATHAATQFIETNMRVGAARIFPAGKGTISMWRSIRDYSAGAPS